MAGKTTAGPEHPYLDLVAARAPAAVKEWLFAQSEGLSHQQFAVVYAGAGRRLGVTRVEPTAEESARLVAQGLLVPRGWTLGAVGRVALLALVCKGLDRDGRVRLAQDTFKTGDNDERAALLKALSMLPEPEAFVELAIDACRSHVQQVFEAIACENPYPARHFPEHNFNQMVLKSFFTGTPVQRIEGLATRRSPELARMAEAYASERRAAGRTVPADLPLVAGPLPKNAPN
jgi:hypothetical protein